MSDYISRESAISGKKWSYDLKQYVVPVKHIINLPSVESNYADTTEAKDMLRVLFNRCLALTEGQMCGFCGMRQECNNSRSILIRTGTEEKST